MFFRNHFVKKGDLAIEQKQARKEENDREKHTEKQYTTAGKCVARKRMMWRDRARAVI